MALPQETRPRHAPQSLPVPNIEILPGKYGLIGGQKELLLGPVCNDTYPLWVVATAARACERRIKMCVVMVSAEDLFNGKPTSNNPIAVSFTSYG